MRKVLYISLRQLPPRLVRVLLVLYCVVLYYFISYHNLLFNITEGSLEAKLPTIWTDEKQSREEAERRERLEERRVEEKE